MDENKEAYELIESAAGYAGNLYNGLQKIATDIREGNTDAGIGTLPLALEGLEWLLGAVAGLNELDGKFAGFETEALGGLSKELKEAVSNRDFVLLADLIEFEILPIIDKWGNELDNKMDI